MGQSRGSFRRRRTRRLGRRRAGAGRCQCRSILSGRLLGDQPKPADRRRHRAPDRGGAHGGQCLPPCRRAGRGGDDRFRRGRAPILGAGAGLARWWRTMDELALQAPESVEATASRMGEILSAGNINAFESFVAAGLKLAAGDRRRRLKFFTLQDELARRLIERASAGIGFAETERQTKAFVTSLWGSPASAAEFLRRHRPDCTTPRRDRGAADPSAGYLSRHTWRCRLRALQGRGGARPGPSRARRAPVRGRHPETASDRACHPDRGCPHRVAGDAPTAGIAQAVVALPHRRAGRRRHGPHPVGAAGPCPVRPVISGRRQLCRQRARDVRGPAAAP